MSCTCTLHTLSGIGPGKCRDLNGKACFGFVFVFFHRWSVSTCIDVEVKVISYREVIERLS